MKQTKKILAVSLAMAMVMAIPSKAGAYTFNKKVDSDVYEVSDIKNLQMIKDGATTDIKMLNDIVERAYNNNFQNKNYIIKNQSEDLGRWDSDGYDLWGNYVLSRGDTYIATTFTEKAVVRDGEDYYHSVSVTSKPAWDSGAISGGVKCIDAFDRETRSIDSKYWTDYMNGIKKAEKEIGFTEGNDLCDFQLILQTYIWIKDNIKSDTSPNVYLTRGQTAIEGILGGATMCAGQSRLFNRFMHDFGIESYWIDNNKDHAWNTVKITHRDGYAIFGSVDCQSKTYEADYTNPTIYTFNILAPVSQGKDYYNDYTKIPEGRSILAYSSDFVNTFSLAKEQKKIENVTYFSKLPKYTKSNGAFIQNADCPYCKHINETNLVHHSFTEGKLSTEKNDINIKKENDKNIIENAGFEVFDNKHDNYFKVEKGSEVVTETNTTTAAPTTTEEPTSDDSEVTKETTAPDVEVPTTIKSEVEVPTTTEPEIEVPTTASRPESATSDRVVTIPTKAETSTTPEATTSKKSEEVTTTKATLKPSKVKKVTAKNNRKKSIKITWKKTTNAKKYKIQYSTSKKFKKKVVTKTTKKLKYTIKKLAKGKTYYIRVRGVNGKEVGKWSSTKKVKIKK